MADYDINSSSEMLIQGFAFALELDNVPIGFFRSVSGLGSSTQVIDHKIVNEKGQEIIVKVPGRVSYDDITLKKAIRADDRELWDWRQLIVDGNVKKARRNGSIVLFDPAGTELARWNFFNAWPTSWKGSGMDSTAGEVMTEDLTICHEGLVKEK